MQKNFLYRVFCGFFLGISVFAPGLSGSVIAIIMGIYQDLLDIISNPFKQLKKNIFYCLPLGIGAAISAVLFVISFKYLFETYEKATYLLFVGLISGNLPVIFVETKKFKFRNSYLFAGLGALAIAVTIGLLGTGVTKPSGSEAITFNLIILAVSGISAGAAALVPGMSVSMILIMMGVYGQLIFVAESFLRMDFTYMLHFIFFAASAVFGLVLASRGIKAVFEKSPGFANSAVLGFMTGSLIVILIQSLQLTDVNFNWLTGGITLAVGLMVSMVFVKLSMSMTKDNTLS